MQANCPQCSQRISIDDAKVPDRPFTVKCPKCQTPVKLPGRAAAAPLAAPPVAAAPPPVEAPPPTEEARVQMMAQLRREMTLGEAPVSGRALVALQDRGQAGQITLVLSRLGYGVDSIEEPQEAIRLAEHGAYSLLAMNRTQAAQGKGETLYQRISRLPPEARRKLFVLLVGDEFKTGDGTQAFVTLSDLVVSGRDVASSDAVLKNALAERTRLFQVYLDARHRHESAAS